MSLMRKLSQFAKTPQGKKLQEKAMNMAKDPKTKEKVSGVVDKIKKDDKKDEPTATAKPADVPPAAGGESASSPPPPPPPAAS